MELSKQELKNIVGGESIGTVINAITKAFSTIFDFGRSVGSALRRITSKKYCEI